jgi:hypothetical protein
MTGQKQMKKTNNRLLKQFLIRRVCVFRFDPVFLHSLKELFYQVWSQDNPYFLENDKIEVLGPAKRRFTHQHLNFQLGLAGSTHTMMWIWANSQNTLQLFQNFLDKIECEEKLNKMGLHNFALCGACFVYIYGNKVVQTNYHRDFSMLQGKYKQPQVLTILTPLFELEEGMGHLEYVPSNAKKILVNANDITVDGESIHFMFEGKRKTTTKPLGLQLIPNTKVEIQDTKSKRAPYSIGSAYCWDGSDWLHRTERYSLPVNKCRVLVSLNLVKKDRADVMAVARKTLGDQTCSFWPLDSL